MEALAVILLIARGPIERGQLLVRHQSASQYTHGRYCACQVISND
jgi:hypothetical protein